MEREGGTWKLDFIFQVAKMLLWATNYGLYVNRYTIKMYVSVVLYSMFRCPQEAKKSVIIGSLHYFQFYLKIDLCWQVE